MNANTVIAFLQAYQSLNSEGSLMRDACTEVIEFVKERDREYQALKAGKWAGRRKPQMGGKLIIREGFQCVNVFSGSPDTIDAIEAEKLVDGWYLSNDGEGYQELKLGRR